MNPERQQYAVPLVPAEPGPFVSRRVAAAKMVARDAELEAVTRLLGPQPPAVVVVEGEAGIGKTRLVTELMARPESTQLRWLVGACRRVSEPFPMGAVIEALRDTGESLAGVTLSPVTGSLRALLPELAPWLPLAPDPLGDPAAERHRVFRGLVALLAQLGPAVLVLEDLHWSDPQTREFLGYLMADLPAQVSVVVTYRSEDAAPSVRAVTATVPASTQRAHLCLGPLDAEATGALVKAILDTDRVSDEFALHMCTKSAGVPFVVEELLALLRERGVLVRRGGRWVRRALDGLDVPSGVRDLVLERVGRLSQDGRRVIQIAATIGEPDTPRVLTEVCARLGVDGMAGIEDALAKGVLVEHGDALGFRHTLAAQAVYGTIPMALRKQVHGHVAAAVQETEPVPLGRLAHHLKEAGDIGGWLAAAEQAADQATELGNYANAVSLLEDILRNGHLDATSTGRVAIKLGRAAHENLSSSPELVALLRAALELDVGPTTRGELAFYTSTAVQDAGGDPMEKWRLLELAVANLDDRPELQAWAMVGLGVPMNPNIPVQEHKIWSYRALDVIPRVRDRSFESFILSKVVMNLLLVGDPAWRQHAARLDRVTLAPQQKHSEARSYYSVGSSATYTAHYAEADRFLARAREAAIDSGSQSVERFVLGSRAMLNYCRGQWNGLADDVESLIDELEESLFAKIDLELVAACLALARGHVGDAHERLARILPDLESMTLLDLLPFAIDALGRMAMVGGDSRDSLAAIDRFLAELDRKGMWAPIVRALPSVIATFVASGQRARAVELTDIVRAQLEGLDVPLRTPAISFADGILATDTGDWAASSKRLMAAANEYDAIGCPYEAAQATEKAGLALSCAGSDDAEDTLRAAMAGYEGLGATGDLARCTKAARQYGVRVPVPHRGGRKGYGDQLSPREAETARLAAAGLTNRQIAERLFLSPATVSKHVAGAMRKLDVHTRAGIGSRLASTDLNSDELSATGLGI